MEDKEQGSTWQGTNFILLPANCSRTDIMICGSNDSNISLTITSLMSNPRFERAKSVFMFVSVPSFSFITWISILLACLIHADRLNLVFAISY